MDLAHGGTESDIPSSVWFYLVFAFGISWGAYGLRQAGDWPVVVDDSLGIIVKFGPSLAGLIAAFRFAGIQGLRNIIGSVLCINVGFKWYVVALLLPIVIILIALPIRSLFGSIAPIESVGTGTMMLFVTTFAVRFFAGGGLGEELGWRGFMLPRLQERVGSFNASLTIGLFHGAWHFPAYGAPVILLTLYTVAGSFVFTWLYNRTNGSILIPALLHASGNASLPWIESIVPAIDGEILFPLLVFAIWIAFAWLLVRTSQLHSQSGGLTR